VSHYAQRYIELVRQNNDAWESQHHKRHGVIMTIPSITRVAREALEDRYNVNVLVWKRLTQLSSIPPIKFSRYMNSTGTKEEDLQVIDFLMKLSQPLVDKPLSDYM